MLSREREKKEKEKKVLELVIERRKKLAREGVRKLLHGITAKINEQGVHIGRDKLFDLLRKNKMLVRPKKRYVRTTNSIHPFRKYSNLIKDMEITRANQVWVSDITYIKLLKGHCYLALVTDAYSRKILGYDISDSLELTGALRALKQALRQLPEKRNLIHHSDRGVQYCSYDYVNVLKKNGIKISMTEENHCYENAIAERVNGILKDEFYLDQVFAETREAKFAARSAIDLYNNQRLHLSLNYKTPHWVHKYAA
jgi:transposase InsO family protein